MAHRMIISRVARLCVLVSALFLLAPHVALAHDIPNDVTVQAFLKPDGTHMYLLIRAPLMAMRDIEFPQSDSGFLDLPNVDASIREAATLWISNPIEVYENDD